MKNEPQVCPKGWTCGFFFWNYEGFGLVFLTKVNILKKTSRIPAIHARIVG